MVYAKNGEKYIDYYKLFNLVQDEIISSALKEVFVDETKERLDELSVLVLQPERAPLVQIYEVYQAIKNIKTANDAITIESNLQVKTIYYADNPFEQYTMLK